MDRRDFLKLAGLTGISVFAPWAAPGVARAEEATWPGPYFLHMHASGGWDPTLFCDAKLTAGGSTPVYENRLVTAVGEVNGIPVPTATKAGKFLLTDNGNPVEDPQNFFQTVGRDVLVINGLDTQTNNHETGVQGLACGHNDVELPALAALFAGMVAEKRNIPMAFIAGGSYNRTGDVVGISRFPGDKVQLLASPFKAAPSDKEALLGDVAIRRIAELRRERYEHLEREASLPREKRTLRAQLDAARGGSAMALLKDIAQAPAPTAASFANDLAPDTRAYLGAGATGRFVELGRPLETVLRCFRAGVSAAATYSQGGFDTHSNHDAAQVASLGTFVARLRYVLLRAQQLGIRDRLFVLVTSDFGRTPRYNDGNGKDHWNVSSALVAGPGIRGGRAIGKTDAGHKVFRVRKGDVGQVLPDSDTSGSRIHAGHLHRELRRVLGVERAKFTSQFQLPAEDAGLPLLG